MTPVQHNASNSMIHTKKIIFGLLLILAIIAGLRWYLLSERRYPVLNQEQPIGFENIFATPTPEPLPELTSIEQVFDSTRTTTSSPLNTSTSITLLATGDVLLARSINYKMLQLQDFTWPFVHTAELLKAADLTFINLETPLITTCPTRVDGMFFCGDLRGVESLQYAGIDVVNLANNHAANFGLEGVLETEKALTEQNFTISGLLDRNAGFTTVKGTTFAFLGYNEVNEQAGVTPADPEIIKKEVAAAKQQADLVVVQFHWGNEYTYSPSDNQKRLARIAIDAGADLIIGNHPHWYQPIEFYNGKLITYSHGNMVFDQMWSRETREGVVGEYTFQDKKLVGVRFVPVLIENYGQPRILDGAEATSILENLEKQSYLLNSTQ